MMTDTHEVKGWCANRLCVTNIAMDLECGCVQLYSQYTKLRKYGSFNSYVFAVPFAAHTVAIPKGYMNELFCQGHEVLIVHTLTHKQTAISLSPLCPILHIAVHLSLQGRIHDTCDKVHYIMISLKHKMGQHNYRT